MSKSNTWERNLLALVFQNSPATLIGDAAGLLGSAVAGNLYISLHTADPTEDGYQNTSEATYTSYARAIVVRSAVGWTITGDSPTQVKNAAAIYFPMCSGSSSTITHIGVGTDYSGAGKLLYIGQLGTPLSVSTNITPSFAAGDLIITED